MMSISPAKLLTRFENYLAGVFHPIPEEQVVAGAIQSFYGWVFPFLRNAFICGVLKYLADASGSMMLQTLAIIAYVVLVGYCNWRPTEGTVEKMTKIMSRLSRPMSTSAAGQCHKDRKQE